MSHQQIFIACGGGGVFLLAWGLGCQAGREIKHLPPALKSRWAFTGAQTDVANVMT